ncbi:MAG: N-acetyl-alpha-D-glucosaminyl L-malate synthase BshA [Ignavibacteria bacterium]|nr:N-acetyl-alpha-D-glucosaminyl L-malate synthase BshA [Ignavibacteria bacterium]
MNIAIVCYPTIGGSGIVATELAYGIAEFGHKVHIISYSPPFRYNKFNENIYFHNVSPPNYPLFEFPLYTLSLTGKIAEIVELENIEIIHCHYAIPHSFSGIVAKEIVSPYFDVKVVTTLHGTDVTLVGTQPNFRPIIHFALNKSDAITCVSEFLYHTTIREFAPIKPIEVISNFVDVDEYQRKANPELRRRFAKDNEKIIVHISNFRPVKRVSDVVLAFNNIRKEIPSKLILVGDGPEMPKVEYLVKKHNLVNDIFFLGEQSSIVEILSISDLFLLTSEIESFGLAALEALSCEVPVACYGVGGLGEIIINDFTGYTCEFGDIDALAFHSKKILSDEALYKKLSQNCRKFVLEKFDKRIIIPKYIELFYNLINKN